MVLFNTNGHYGYAMEAMGHLSLYNNNLAQANATGNSSGLAYGCGPVQSMSNNTVQGGFNPYIFNESGDSFPCGTDTTPAQLTGNVTGATVSTITSVAPGISPSAGSYSSPLTVTLTDPGLHLRPSAAGQHLDLLHHRWLDADTGRGNDAAVHAALRGDPAGDGQGGWHVGPAEPAG